MTQTESRGAANQAGARIDTDAYAKAEDFLPLKGIDHVEFWVGNARQDPLDLAQPVGNHLRQVGEHLPRPPACLIRVIECLGQRPRRPSLNGRSSRCKARPGSSQSVEQVIHARQCGM